MARKPNGYWTKVRCHTEAQKYNNITEFRNNSMGAYLKAYRSGWLKDITTHMKRKNAAPQKWNFQACEKAAKKCKTRTEFQKKFPSAYHAALKYKWLNDLCHHMKQGKRPNGYWTFERCLEEALLYDNRKDFERNSPAAYSAARKKGWFYEITAHMPRKLKPKKYWDNYDICKASILKCKTKSEFIKKYKGAYRAIERNEWQDLYKKLINSTKENGYWLIKHNVIEAAHSAADRTDFIIRFIGAYKSAQANGWLEEVYKILPLPKSNNQTRMLYSYEFPDKSVYVGLTWNYEDRFRHREIQKDHVWEKSQKLKPKIIKHNKKYSPHIAGIEEAKLIDKYREDGWIILNKMKAGYLGGGKRKSCPKKAQKLYKSGMTKTEVAKMLNISTATVNIYLNL